jgi:hypothetical protein
LDGDSIKGGYEMSMIKICNAIKDAVTEMERSPNDSVQDIWNEVFDKWETGLRMDVYHNVELKEYPR